MAETLWGARIPGPLGRTRAGPWILGTLVVLALLAVFVLRPVRRLWKVNDYPVYHAAAQAALEGRDLYAIDPDVDLPYLYPPTLAVLLTPLAGLPVKAAGVLWLLLKLAALLVCLRVLGRVLPPRGGEPAWLVPALGLLTVLTLVDNELRNGQADVWVLLAVVAALAATVRGRPFCAGLAVAFGAALKVTPIFLAVWFLTRRSGRGLAGVAVGLVVLLGLVPALVLGPRGAWAANGRFVEVMIAPYAEGGTHEAEPPRDVPGYSLRAAAYRWLEAPRLVGGGEDTGVHALRLDAPTVEWIYRALAALLVVLAVAAVRRPAAPEDPWGCAREIALLAATMVIVSPLSRAAHFVVLLPAALWLAAAWRRRGVARAGVVLLGATLLIQAPLLLLPRDVRMHVAGNGAVLLGALLLWAALLGGRQLAGSAGDATGC